MATKSQILFSAITGFSGSWHHQSADSLQYWKGDEDNISNLESMNRVYYPNLSFSDDELQRIANAVDKYIQSDNSCDSDNIYLSLKTKL